ncbi:hypothetical protein [Prochlorococcus sp. MIT 0701]|uniref:hypothetical protein n=1 Tax=unclassified Prochlorococcus TaxID=2627481 RepID=UPI000533BDA2|nr:hypothetical protein EV12_2370 [Prochlorococcus sp. MIT 0701]KGG26447.1 hypothetical protein EV13_2581 [Prochlorococcus sp. MIT 0702]KGG31131.1 hypothetical protein EV14_2502 [Prochlorococcus sp. MIT 0703]
MLPLLLLLGSHVCQDVSLMRQRFQQQGVSTRLVPCLGVGPSCLGAKPDDEDVARGWGDDISA